MSAHKGSSEAGKPSRRPARGIVLPVVAAVITATLAACGGGGSQAEPPAAEPEPPAASAEPAAPPPPAETPTASTVSATVAVTDSPFGPILVGGDGMTLYLYTEDKDGKIACLDEPAAYAPGDPSVFACTDPWPPLLTEGDPQAGEGVDASLLGTTERPDGSVQVTYNGQPLYRSSFDAAPGSTFGKGAWGQWFLVAVEGDPVTVTTEG